MLIVVAVGCQSSGETGVESSAVIGTPAGVERVVAGAAAPDDTEPAAADPIADEPALGSADTSTTSTPGGAVPTTTAATVAAVPTTTLPSPTTTVVPTTTAAPSPTTTVGPVPAGPVLPAGSWDAATAGSSAGARTSEVVASGIHVGPGQTHATITDAVTAAGPGATIVIHDNGDAYRESFSADDGWVGKPIRFVAAPGERPIVSGADIVGEWTPDGGRWFHAYTDDRFEFALPTSGAILPEQISGSSPNAGLLEQVFVDGQPLRQIAALDGLGPGSFFVDRAADRIYLGDDPTGRTIEITSRHRALMFAAGASGSSVEGVTISGFAPRHLDGTAMVVLDGATDIVLRDVVLTRSSATALVAVGADRLLLERVTMVANGARGLSGDRLDDVVIRRSRFEANNTERFDAADCGGGTYCVLAGAKLTRSSGVEVSFSDFSDNQATGFWCDLECRDLVFVGNHAVANDRHGAYFEVSEGAVIEANILAANGEAGVKTSGSRDVRIAHNTFVANGAHLNIGADYRPGSIGFHTSPQAHMRDIDVVDNVFAESSQRTVVIDPVNLDAAPDPWARLGVVADNLYLLTDATVGSEWRFRMVGGGFELDPTVAAAPIAVETGDPLTHFDGGGLADLRLVGPMAGLGADPLSTTAAVFFPALGTIPPGAPLG
ncbi:MAG: right-handed parallel beta-helix repeat-containing protein [Actinomycetota bacterium]